MAKTYKDVFLDITDTNPKGSGKKIINENGSLYGWLQPQYHNSRSQTLTQNYWPPFIKALEQCIPQAVKQSKGTYQVVIAAFLPKERDQRFPERDFHVLGSFTKEMAKHVHANIQDTFQNWIPNTDSPPPEDTSTSTTKEDTPPKDIYSRIQEYCAIHQGLASSFGKQYSPRMNKIIECLTEYNIPYFVDSFSRSERWYHNIILPGSSSQLFTAHHDTAVVGDCANDNSASIINLIALKILRPHVNIVFTDAEEIGSSAMYGAKRVAELWHQIKNGNPVHIQGQPLLWEQMRWIVNLELTGSGGKRFFYGSYPQYRGEKPSALAAEIHRLFDAEFPIQDVDVPLSDSKVFVEQGIDSLVLNPLPPLLPNGKHRYPCPHDPVRAADGTMLDLSIVRLCNSPVDRLDLPHMTTQYMKEFVEEVLVPIADIC